MINSHGIPSFVPIGNLANLREELAQIHDNSLSDAEMLISMIRAVNRMGLLVGEMADKWSVVESWIKTDGINSAVVSLMERWRTDGTLTEILNKTALSEINKRIDTFENTLRTTISELKDDVGKSIETMNQNNKTLWSQVQAQIKGLSGGAVKGVFATLAELKSKYPQGADGLFLVMEDKHLYYWEIENKAWTDVGNYLEPVISDYGIAWNKIGQPITRGIVTLGEITIDAIGRTIKVTENLAIDINFEFIYPNLADTIPLPNTNDPIYFYYDRDAKKYGTTIKNANFNNSDVLIGILYQKHFYAIGNETHNHIIFEEGQELPYQYSAQVVYGNFEINLTENTISTTDNQTIFAKLGQQKHTDKLLSVNIPTDSTKAIVYVFYDFVNDILICTNDYKEVPNKYWYLFALYKGQIFDNDSEHFSFVDYNYQTKINNLSEVILFNDSYLINVTHNNNVGSVTFPAGTCYFINADGRYIRIANETKIDFEDPQSEIDKRNLISLYFRDETTIYASFYKHRYSDIKLFSIYDEKIYGSNPKAYVVNGITNGGWEDSTTNLNNENHISDWNSTLSDGKETNIGWLGDSTWEGYLVENKDNIFPVYLNKLLTDIGTNVKSFNCSKGGYTTKQLYDNFDTLTSKANNLKIVVIGGGLNDSATGAGLKESKKYLKLIINKLLAKGIIPVIATTQATALLNATTNAGGDWNKKQKDFALINQMRRDVANQNGIDLIDFEKYTHEFIENSDATMESMFTDYLHGKDPIHLYEASIAMMYLFNDCDEINSSSLIGITTMNANSNVSYNKGYKSIALTNGFKVAYRYTSDSNDTLIDYKFCITDNAKKWTLSGVNDGVNVNVNVDGNEHVLSETGKISDLSSGYHHVVVTVNSGEVDFKGLKVENVQ